MTAIGQLVSQPDELFASSPIEPRVSLDLSFGTPNLGMEATAQKSGQTSQFSEDCGLVVVLLKHNSYKIIRSGLIPLCVSAHPKVLPQPSLSGQELAPSKVVLRNALRFTHRTRVWARSRLRLCMSRPCMASPRIGPACGQPASLSKSW